MNDIKLRLAVKADLPTLLDFEQGIVEEERPYNDVLKEKGAHYYDLAKLVDDQDTCVLLAVSGDTIIGSGYAQIRQSRQAFNHEQHGYLGFMYVLPEYRGKGVNKKIVDYLINWCKEREMTCVYLDVYTYNEPAVRAYEKTGFEPLLTNMRLKLD